MAPIPVRPAESFQRRLYIPENLDMWLAQNNNIEASQVPEAICKATSVSSRGYDYYYLMISSLVASSIRFGKHYPVSDADVVVILQHYYSLAPCSVVY